MGGSVGAALHTLGSSGIGERADSGPQRRN